MLLVQSPKDWLRDWNVETNRTSGDYTNYSMVKMGQNTAKSPGDSERLTRTQTPVKDQQLTLI